MHASQLAEIGSWIANHAATLIYGEQEQPRLVSTCYWQASKIRAQRWLTALKVFEKDFEEPDYDHNPWPALEILISEILTSELLTRVWSASVLHHDQHHGTDELVGLAHSVHVSHIEAKNRALRIMIRARAHDEDAFDRLNALRRKIERWTDLFLGQLPMPEKAAMFGFDRNRVIDFHQEHCDSEGNESELRKKILSANFQSEMAKLGKFPGNPDLNREIASGILACFPADRFDSYGLPKSARMLWMEKAHMDTQYLLNQLDEFEKAGL